MPRVEDHLRLAWIAANKFTPRGHCVEDSEFYAEALIALMMAARSYKVEFGKFSTFASRCIRNRIYNLYKAHRNKIKVSSLENDVEDKEALAFDIKALMKCDGKKRHCRQLKIVERHYLKGESYQFIADEMGVTRVAVMKLAQRGIALIRTRFQEAPLLE